MRKTLLAVAVLFAACGGDTENAEPVEVLSVQGDTHQETDDFTVEGRWSLTYETTKDGVNIFVRTPDGNGTEYIPASGSATETYRQGGTFYLELDAPIGRYDITVVDEPG